MRSSQPTGIGAAGQDSVTRWEESAAHLDCVSTPLNGDRIASAGVRGREDAAGCRSKSLPLSRHWLETTVRSRPLGAVTPTSKVGPVCAGPPAALLLGEPSAASHASPPLGSFSNDARRDAEGSLAWLASTAQQRGGAAPVRCRSGPSRLAPACEAPQPIHTHRSNRLCPPPPPPPRGGPRPGPRNESEKRRAA